MITLKKACAIAESVHPDKYVGAVNEDKNVYECLLLNKGEPINGRAGILPVVIIHKSDGSFEDGLFSGEYDLDDNFRHYRWNSKEEKEKSLNA